MYQKGRRDDSCWYVSIYTCGEMPGTNGIGVVLEIDLDLVMHYT
jgi:hypothetical protein